MKELSVKILRTEEELIAFFPLWEELLSKISNSIMYIEPSWVSLWWKHLSKERKLHVLCFFDKENLVGICPLMAEETKAYTKIFFIGAPLSGNMDFIINPDYTEDVFRVLLDYAEDKRKPYVFYLQGFPETSPNYGYLKEALKKRQLPFYVRQTKNYFLNLENKVFDSYYRKRFSKSKIKSLERKRERLRKIAPLQFRQGSKEEMTTAFGIHELRLARKSFKSSFSKDNARKFFLELSNRNDFNFQTALYFCTVGDSDISFIYLFYYKDQILLKRIGHDDTFRTFSPGSILLHSAMKEFFASGQKILSFGTGEDEYKTLWTDEYYHIDSISFSSKNRTARLFWLFRKGIHSCRDKVRNNRRLLLTLRKIAGNMKYVMHKKRRAHWQTSAQNSLQSLYRKIYAYNRYLVLERKLKHFYPIPDSKPESSKYTTRYFTMSDLADLSGLMKCRPEDVIQRLDKQFRCCLVLDQGEIIHCAWVSFDRIVVPEVSLKKTISSASVFLSETFSISGKNAATNTLQSEIENFLYQKGFRKLCYTACFGKASPTPIKEKVKYSFTVTTTLGKTKSIRTL